MTTPHVLPPEDTPADTVAAATSTPPTSPWDATKLLIVGLVAAVALLVGGVGGYLVVQGSTHRPVTSQQSS